MADSRNCRKQYYGEVFSASLAGRGGEAHVSGQMRSSIPPKPKACTNCGTTSTPQWREGPLGPRTLCNACGVKRVRHLNKLRDTQHYQGAPALKVSRTQSSSRTSTPPSSWPSSPSPPLPADVPLSSSLPTAFLQPTSTTNASTATTTFLVPHGSGTTATTTASTFPTASRSSGTTTATTTTTSEPLCFEDEEFEDLPLLTPAQSAALMAPPPSVELLAHPQHHELMRAQSTEQLLARVQSADELLGSRSPSSAGSAQPQYHMDMEVCGPVDLEEPSFASHFNLDSLDCPLHPAHREPSLGMDITHGAGMDMSHITHGEPALGLDSLHRQASLGMGVTHKGPTLRMDGLQGETALGMGSMQGGPALSLQREASLGMDSMQGAPALDMDAFQGEAALGSDTSHRGPVLRMDSLQREAALAIDSIHAEAAFYPHESALPVNTAASPKFDCVDQGKAQADNAMVICGNGRNPDTQNCGSDGQGRDEAVEKLEEKCRAAGVSLQLLQPQQLAELQQLWQQAEEARQEVTEATASVTNATQRLAEEEAAAKRRSGSAAQAAQHLYDMALQLDQDFDFQQLLAAARAPETCPAAAAAIAAASLGSSQGQGGGTAGQAAAAGAEAGGAGVAGAIGAVAAAASDAVGVDDPELKAMLQALMQDALAKLTAGTDSKAAGGRLQGGCSSGGGAGAPRWQEYVTECDLQLADQLIMAAATEAASAMAAMLPPDEFLALAEAAAS